MTPGIMPMVPTSTSGPREDQEDRRASVTRPSNLPKDLPSWFAELDRNGDRDGQVGLYEWKEGGKKISEFLAMDLNSDGYLTIDEYYRWKKKSDEEARKRGDSASDQYARGNDRMPDRGSDRGPSRGNFPTGNFQSGGFQGGNSPSMTPGNFPIPTSAPQTGPTSDSNGGQPSGRDRGSRGPGSGFPGMRGPGGGTFPGSPPSSSGGPSEDKSSKKEDRGPKGGSMIPGGSRGSRPPKPGN